uniref:Uncharacterized protein n=1 Tax=Avena sativa TaxID=4498 RepID=A0ACD5WAC1_AVESA
MAGREEQGSRAAMAMAGRSNGKRKGDGERKGRERKKSRQKFCRLFLAPESGERLRIPPSFSQYLQNPPTELVYLKGQSGSTWPAELASDTEGLFFGHGWKQFVMDHSIESGDILTFSYDGRSQFSVVVFDGMCIEKPSAFHAKPSNALVFITESDEEDNEKLATPLEENNGTKSKRAVGPGVLVGYQSRSLNNTEDSDTSNRVLQEIVPRKDSSKSSAMFRFFKGVDECGKTVVQVQREPEVMSGRLLVSEEKKNYALQKAKQYKSKNPFTLEIMKDSNVYKTFFMIIPGEFVRDYLPHTDKNLTLWDPLGKAWEVTYVYCSKRSAGGFSKGWSNFSRGNHLETFDVCVFELFSVDNIKVHIYRASAALSPYILDCNK